jgi:restriction endonuclease Mrr
MPCDTRPFTREQTLADRIREVTKVMQDVVEKGITTGKVKVVVDKKNGGIAFVGLSEQDRRGVRDGCIYRRIMSKGSATARLAIAQAEQLAGRTTNKQAIAQGLHFHPESGWHEHKG